MPLPTTNKYSMAITRSQWSWFLGTTSVK